MPYPRQTLTALRASAMQDITASDLPNADGFLRRAVLRVIAWVLAGFAYLHDGYLDWISLQSTPFTATGEYMEGWAALVRKEYFSEASLLFHNLQVVGWVWLGIGVFQVLASYLIIARRPSGRVLGIALAALSMLAWFFTIGAYPMWAMMIVAIDALIIYGLAAHGEVFE